MVEKAGRVTFVAVLFLVICALFFIRLMKLQLVEGETHAAQSQSRVVTQNVVKAARGEILDRYCRPIVQNQSAFIVEFNTAAIKDTNSTILRTIQIFEECDQAYIDTFPVSKNAPYFYEETLETSKTTMASFKEFLSTKKIIKIEKDDPADAPINKTAEEVMESLIKYYKLTDFPESDARKIIAVRYEIELRTENRFFTFASNINIETATSIKENNDELIGVYLSEEPVRNYTTDYFASHIIGTVGRIYKEEYETLKEKGYALNDTVGKDGIEKICEDYLRGTNGLRSSVKDVTGNTTEIIEDKPAKKGNDVILTLDMNMQLIVEKSLPEIIQTIKEEKGEDAGTSGAVVFMDIATSEVLASVSWPTFNLATYNQDFNELSQQESSPYLNRVISGTFAPGSTYKMVASVMGLEEGYLTPSTTYRCIGKYTYYDDYQPSCFEKKAHGTLNVVGALQKSCNCFFFDVARRAGISKLNEYSYKLGFGTKTGIELANESSGIVAGVDYRSSLGKGWEAGETLLAAIGQTDNTATPLQLCNYVATIARGGVRMEPHIIKSVRNSETGEIISETSPVIVEDLNLSQTTIDYVLKGMEEVVLSGSLREGFRDFKIATVAGKTGTAEVTNGQPSTLLVGVAPAQNPQVAFAVVVENGGSYSSTILSTLVKDTLSYYFAGMDSIDTVNPNSGLLP